MTIAEAKAFVASLKGSVAEMDRLAGHLNNDMLRALVRAQRALARRAESFVASAPALSRMDAQARLAWYGAEGRRFATLVRESGFYDIAAGHLGAFEDMARMSQLALRSGGVAASWADMPRDFIKALQGRELRRWAFLGNEAARKLDDTFLSMVIGGSGRAKMLAEMRSLITGDYAWGDKRGLYEWHAGTYVRTSTHRHMQSFMNAQAQELGLENYLYLGPYDTKTRPFCARLVGQVLERQEIEELDNGQGGDVMSDGGGWNCRHEWVAVPDDLADKMRENPDELGKEKVKKIEPRKAAPKAKAKRLTRVDKKELAARERQAHWLKQKVPGEAAGKKAISNYITKICRCRFECGVEEGTDIRLMRESAKALRGLMQKHPDARFLRVNFNTFSKKAGQRSSTIAHVQGDAPGGARGGTVSRLEFNNGFRGKYKTFERMEVTIKSDFLDKWHAAPGWQGCVDHEFAHVLSNQFGGGSRFASWDGALKKWVSNEGFIFRNISRYGNTNAEEGFAEAFSRWKAGLGFDKIYAQPSKITILHGVLKGTYEGTKGINQFFEKFVAQVGGY